MLRLLVLIAALLLPSTAWAMHLSEGVLPMKSAAATLALALPFIAYGIMRLKAAARDDITLKPLAGLIAAVVFVVSLMPVPVPTAGTCSHPCGTGISGILLGPGISVVITTVALLIQALLLAHGGLSTLGANVLAMGVAGSFVGYAVFRLCRASGLGLGVAGFMAGVLADWATYATTSAVLAMGIRGTEPFFPLFVKIAIAFVPTQLPLGILEGAITGGMIVLLSRKRPDILVRMRVLRKSEASA